MTLDEWKTQQLERWGFTNHDDLQWSTSIKTQVSLSIAGGVIASELIDAPTLTDDSDFFGLAAEVVTQQTRADQAIADLQEAQSKLSEIEASISDSDTLEETP